MTTQLTDALREKVRSYKPAASTIALMRQTPVMLLVGISAAGKDTIKKELLATGAYHHIVSHTTRPPRSNQGIMEQDGVEYHFITHAQAGQMLDAQAYIEANIFGDTIYGTSVAEIQVAHDTGKVAITDMEIQGVAQYVALEPSVVPVFILPPSYNVWQTRFLSRYGGEVDEADYMKRLAINLHELEHVLSVSYFKFVINDDLQTAVQEVDRLARGGMSGTREDEAKAVAEAISAQLRLKLAA